jgi:hypothetical protein
MRKTVIVFLISAFPCLAADAWVPYVAKYRSAHTITAVDGTIISQSVTTATEMRSADGSITRIHEGPPTGIFHDAKNGNFYELQFAGRTAKRTRTVAVTHALRGSRQTPVGSKIVNGIPCLGFTIFEKSPSGESVPVGTSWISMENEFIAKEEFEVEPAWNAKLGRKRTLTVERYDIQLTSPPAAQFGIPADFAIDMGTANALAMK